MYKDYMTCGKKAQWNQIETWKINGRLLTDMIDICAIANHAFVILTILDQFSFQAYLSL